MYLISLSYSNLENDTEQSHPPLNLSKKNNNIAMKKSNMGEIHFLSCSQIMFHFLNDFVSSVKK